MRIHPKGSTGQDRCEELKAALREQIGSPNAAALLDRLDRCGRDWYGRFTCRCPACPSCKQRNTRARQRAVRAAFDGATNSDMALATICLPACRDIADVGRAFRKGEQDLSNRLKAARLTGIRLIGFHEVDGISVEQFSRIRVHRTSFLDRNCAIALKQDQPTWVPSMHVIISRENHDLAAVRAALCSQWPVRGQVHVKAFSDANTLNQNLDRATTWATKVSNLMSFGTDSHLRWPVAWDVELHSYLISVSSRTPFEFMRFSRGLNNSRAESASYPQEEVEPLPFTYGFTLNPMPYYPTWHHAGL